MKMTTKKITTIGMLCAIAFVIVAFVRIPVVMFLKYEPKDVIITIDGFMMGPMASLIISTVVALLEMVTISDTGIIGAVMNLISSCAFCCTAAYIYKKKHTMQGAVIGLISGAVIMTGVMLLWNYLITPLYMGYPREAVAAMLVPVFLPFNLLKGFLNAGISLLIYKPVVGALRRARLIETSSNAPANGKKRLNPGVVAVAIFLVATGVVMALVLSGVI
ncbi:MAG: ECF transporter S component [Clostridia bacterium]|nr:ECF transporter S component [Clostridia bacterium]